MVRAVKFLLEHACAALFLDPGMGKTAIVLAAFKFLKEAGVAKRMLVIAPVRPVYTAWPKEAQKWADFNGLRLVVLHDKRKDERLAEDADVYVVNYEGLDWLTRCEKTKTTKRLKDGSVAVAKRTTIRVDMKRWKALGFDTLVLDELSKLKNYGTQRYDLITKIHRTFARRWGLTGSPAPKGLLDLFPQCFALDEGRSLGRYVTHYRRQHFYQEVGNVWDWKLQDGHEEQIYARLKPLALRLDADEYLQLPTLVEVPVQLRLPPEAQEVYDAMEEDLLAKIRSKVVTAANAGVASGKCRQIAAGGLYLAPDVVLSSVPRPKQKREWVDLHTEKVDALADLVDELQGEPLLVAYEYEHDLARLKARFGKDLPVLGGKGVNPRDAPRIIRAWQTRAMPLLAAQATSVAHGTDGLQEIDAAHLAWHTLTWDYEVYDQLNRRLRRQGNKAKRLFVYHFLMVGTVDYDVLASLSKKEKGQRALFAALSERARRPARRLHPVTK